MHNNCSKWGSRCKKGKSRRHSPQRRINGSAIAERKTAESFAKIAESLARIQKKDGPAAVVQSIRENSVWSVENLAQQELPFIAVINVDGSRKILITRLNSARNAAMYLMKTINSKWDNKGCGSQTAALL